VKTKRQKGPSPCTGTVHESVENAAKEKTGGDGVGVCGSESWIPETPPSVAVDKQLVDSGRRTHTKKSQVRKITALGVA